MRVQTEEWRRFIPGIRMYKGKKTFFYNGERLFEGSPHNRKNLVYDKAERKSWEVIIILPGVEKIPDGTFSQCKKLKTVIMADSIKKISWGAFSWCSRLEFVKLSKNLEFIGDFAFCDCKSLTSIFIPPSCKVIDEYAFSRCCRNLIFLKVSHNKEEEFELHRECASCDPSEDVIYGILKERGLSSFNVKNKIGITASRYLDENPFCEIEEKKLVNRFILDMMGEIICP